ncbi:MAG: hypothetical protein ABSC38_02320 [Verrucomicrobiia bacterium]
MLPGICSAFLTFAVFLVAVVVRFRLSRACHRLQAMLLIWTLLLAVYGGIYRAFDTPPLTSLEGIVFFGNGILIYLFLFFTFCYCYIVSDHSLSVIYMMALEELPEKRMTLDDLKRKFPYDELLRQRLIDLQNNGFLVVEGESYRLTAKGMRNAAIAGGLKRFLHLEPGG